MLNFNIVGGIDIGTSFLTNSVESFNSVEFQHYKGRRSSINFKILKVLKILEVLKFLNYVGSRSSDKFFQQC